MNAAEIVAALGLQAHPEGGWFRETYRAAESVPAAALPRQFDGPRNISTAIYFLLATGQRSRLHRIRSDEVWHFHAGDPLIIVEIDPAGMLRETLLGADLGAGAVPQHVVLAGAWFGAAPAEDDGRAGFSLAGCTVAPGFDFADFELADRTALLAAYPAHANWIRRLT